MKTAYTPAQQNLLNFAISHDWGRDAYITSEGLLSLYDHDEQAIIFFDDMASLREWAGY